MFILKRDFDMGFLFQFNLPAGYVGLVFLGLALSYTISSPLFGLLSDRMPVCIIFELLFHV